MPYVKEDGGLYNVGFLVSRDGTYDMYEKVHVTPDEIKQGINVLQLPYDRWSKRAYSLDMYKDNKRIDTLNINLR